MSQSIAGYVFNYVLICFVLQLVCVTEFDTELTFTNDKLPLPFKLIILVLVSLILPFVLVLAIIESFLKK